MANKKISELTSVPASLGGSELIPIVQSGTTYKTTLQNEWNQVANLTVQGSATLSGTVIMSTAYAVSGTAQCGGQLHVSLTASIGGTIKFGADGYTLSGWQKLGSQSGNQNIKLQVAFTNTGNNIHRLHVVGSGKGQTSSTNFILCLYTDGGTTPFITYALAANSSATASEGMVIADVYGANADAGFKLIVPTMHFPSVATQATQTRSATVNTGVVNAVSLSIGAAGTTASISTGHLVVYGLLK